MLSSRLVHVLDATIQQKILAKVSGKLRLDPSLVLDMTLAETCRMVRLWVRIHVQRIKHVIALTLLPKLGAALALTITLALLFARPPLEMDRALIYIPVLKPHIRQLVMAPALEVVVEIKGLVN